MIVMFRSDGPAANIIIMTHVILIIDASSPPLRGCIAPLIFSSVFLTDNAERPSYFQNLSMLASPLMMTAMAS